MPELPEVETVRSGLEQILCGRTFVRVVQRRKDLRFPFPTRFAQRLTGRKVAGVGRRAKYILVHLDGAEILAVHLGMTGRFSVKPPPATRSGAHPATRSGAHQRLEKSKAAQLGAFEHQHGQQSKHDHLICTMSDGTVVTYNDARRFGYMRLIAAADLDNDAFFRGLGVEPLSATLTPQYLATRASGKKVDLKAFLMDQRIVAGLGNIYVCEALFRAGLNPWKIASVLATKTAKPTLAATRLASAIKEVLRQAIRAGGSTLRDYKQANGDLGRFQKEFAVYGRHGERCLRPGCRGSVRRKTQSGRSTFYCATCQR